VRRAWRRWRFVRAYLVLRREADRHKAAGHDVEFTAVSEAHLVLRCHGCPGAP
jgi:hypothetical protein